MIAFLRPWRYGWAAACGVGRSSPGSPVRPPRSTRPGLGGATQVFVLCSPLPTGSAAAHTPAGGTLN